MGGDYVAITGSMYSPNAVEWKSTLLGVILGITSFGVEIHSQNSGIHSKVVVWITLFEIGFHYFERGFPLQTKWSLIWLLKEWISTPVHLESTCIAVRGSTRRLLEGWNVQPVTATYIPQQPRTSHNCLVDPVTATRWPRHTPSHKTRFTTFLFCCCLFLAGWLDVKIWLMLIMIMMNTGVAKGGGTIGPWPPPPPPPLISESKSH